MPTLEERLEQAQLNERLNKAIADESFGTAVVDTARAVARGATFGGSDLAEAGVRSLAGPETFKQELAIQNERRTDALARNPTRSILGEVAGGVAVPVGGGFVRGAAGPAGVAGRSAVVGGGSGAVTGATTAILEGEGPLGVVEGAATSGILGAGLGGLAPVAIKVGGVTLGKLANVVAGKVGPKSQAARKILQAVTRDGLSTKRAIARLRQLGPEGGLVDLGPNTQSLGRAATSQPGRAKVILGSALDRRQAGQGGRLSKSVQRGLGNATDFNITSDELLRVRAASARPLYEKAYQKAMPFTPELEGILGTPAGKAALRKAQEIGANDGVLSIQKLIQVAPDGSITMTRVPDMREWDLIKRGLDSVVESNRNDLGILNLSDPRIRSIDGVRKRLVTILKRRNPDYKVALDTFSDQSTSLNAMNLGRKFIRGDEDFLTKQLARFSPNDREFFRLGVARGVQDLLDSGRTSTDITGRLFGSKAMRDKLRTVFRSKREFFLFKRDVLRESRMAATRRVVQGGSPTARIQAEQKDLGTALNVGQDVAMGRFGTAAVDLARNAQNRLTSNPETNALIAKMLKGSDLSSLTRAETLPQLTPDQLRALSAALARVGGEQSGFGRVPLIENRQPAR